MNEDDFLRAEAALNSASLFITEVKRRIAIGTDEALSDVDRLLDSARVALEMANGWIKVVRGEAVSVSVGQEDEDPEE